MASIRFRIGASVDRSVDAAFASIEARAQKARKRIQEAVGGAITGKGSPYRSPAGTAGALGDGGARKLARATRDAQADAWRQIGKIAESELTKAAKAGAREMAKQASAAERHGREFARRTSYTAARFLTPHAPIASFAGRLAGDIARGVGVDFSVAWALGRGVSLQREATALAGQERMGTGRTAGAAAYMQTSREVGEKYATDPAQVMAMMRAFAGKTGEFGAARGGAGSLTSIALAAGVEDLESFGDAAGFAYNQLKGMPDAMTKLQSVMRGIAGQTAMGAVEFKDYAAQMGRIVASSPQWQGDVETKMRQLSALTQLNIESGGATSAAAAARGTASFAATFGKGARIKAFKDAGVNIFTDKSQTQFRDMFSIIEDSFRKTGGNIPKLAGMYADVLGREPITALAGSYKAAGGGEKGIAAVHERLQKYMGATLSKETEAANLKDRENTSAAKAQRFQNRLDAIAEVMAGKVLPEFEKLGPIVEQAASGLASLVGWVAKNPFQAATTALAAAIARAGIENVVRSGIERLLLGAGDKNAAGLGTKAGNLGAALTIAATAVTIEAAGEVMINKAAEAAAAGQRAAIAGNLETENLLGRVEAHARGKGVSGEDIEALQARKAEIEKRMHPDQVGMGELLFGRGAERLAQIQRDTSEPGMADLKDEMARINAALGRGITIRGGVNINGTVQTNNVGGVDGGARDKPPGTQ